MLFSTFLSIEPDHYQSCALINYIGGTKKANTDFSMLKLRGEDDQALC